MSTEQISTTNQATASTTSTPSNSNFNNVPEFNLQFLCSLIPKSFDGKRAEFNEFVANCSNAVNLAHDSQQPALLVFIISKLTGSVRTQLQGKTYTNFEELKAILSSLYQDKKHYIQLMEELNTMKQGLNESVASYHDRIDKLVMRLMNSMTFKEPSEQIGKIETVKELALSRFIYHSIPEISRFLRSQNPADLSEALNKAFEEERALKISYSEYKTKQPRSCSFCSRSGHTDRECFKKQQSKQNRPVGINFNKNRQEPIRPVQNNGNQTFRGAKFCRYCKKQGHLIEECRKREYNNRTRNQNQGQNETFRTTNVKTNSNPDIHLNSANPQVDVSPVEQEIAMA